MKLNLFLLSLTGVVSITLQAVRHDYYLITTPATWTDAQSYCSKNYKQLATVRTADDWERLTAEAARKGLTVTGWIGLFNSVEWLWTDTGLPMNASLSNWSSGQPDNLGGREQCVAMDSRGFWLDYSCTDLKPFICYNATLGELVAVSYTMSWWGSRDHCQAHHTSLASSRNETQNNELQQMVLQQGTSWIGLNRSGWSWIGGVQAVGLPWRPGYPNNTDQNNNCAFVNNKMLEDKLCNNKYYFFCHTQYKVRKQVLKVKIRGDSSVFNPATQSAILQQIKQKLGDHGITNEIKVTWRVQPDGQIFHKESKDEL